MASERIKFTNTEGLALSAVLETPAGPPRAFALFAHCFTCSKNLKAIRQIVEPLRAAGIAVLRFDFTGLGASEGDFADTSFSSNVSDLLAACAYLTEHHTAPALLIGHSLGGTAVLQAAQALPAVQAVVTIGSPSVPSHVLHLLRDGQAAIERDGEAEVDLGGRTFRIRKQFLDDLQAHDVLAQIPSLRKALLILHAPNDLTVGISNASDLFVAAKHPKSFVSLDSADHLLTAEADSTYAGTVIAGWVDRYLPAAAPPAELAGGPEDTVARTRQGGFRTDIVAAGHALVADEPASVGGSNAGPTPYDLLSAALASCTTMTLEMYAARKGLNLRSSTVRVQHRKVHAADCEHCETQTGKIDQFDRQISFEGELSDAERARLLEIADRCPVHRTLHSEVSVVTTEA
ncbi:MAG: bifunctional alpha/beta hydrolase/OsmC family protein [Pseudomonadota bacterium]